jgi:hypothetical protein
MGADVSEEIPKRERTPIHIAFCSGRFSLDAHICIFVSGVSKSLLVLLLYACGRRCEHAYLERIDLVSDAQFVYL